MAAIDTVVPAMPPLPTTLRCAAAILALLAGNAHAQLFKDPALQALYDAERVAELDATARKRLADKADDAQAVLGLAMAALQGQEGPRREAAITRAQACIKAQPQAAECHYALGTVLGVHAMGQGLMKMAASVGTVKDALLQALALAPQWWPARSAVVEFYLVAPGMLGGSTSKAGEVARAAPRPAQVKALEARIALADERFEQALATLQGLQPGTDSALAEDLAAWTASAGFALLGKGQAAQARPVFERLLRDQPQHAVGAYGLGRLLQEQGASAEAIKWLEQAARARGAAQFPIDYRLGLALQAEGRAEPARAALGRFVAAGRGSGKALDDARKRLAQLGGAPA